MTATTASSAKPYLQIQGLVKKFGDNYAVDNIDLDIYQHEIFALLGSSGSGKSTLLRMLAGMESPNQGKIILDGQDITKLAPYERPINMMFQSYALFPHMTVEQNIAFGLKQDKMPKDEIAARVEEMLRLVQMTKYAKRKPHQLSGGQQQRIALARSLAKRPKILLLDEPLGALDKKLRQQTQLELVNTLEQVGVTCIMVTHDQEEALTMSDRIIVMNAGKIAQDGTPREIYEEPKNLFVAHFIGEINVFDATVIERIDATNVKANVEGRICNIKVEELDIQPNQKLKVLLRPEDIVIEELDEDESSKAIIGHIIDRNYKGMTLESSVKLDHNGMNVLVSEFFNEDDPNIDHEVGQKVALTWHEGWEVVLNDDE